MRHMHNDWETIDGGSGRIPHLYLSKCQRVVSVCDGCGDEVDKLYTNYCDELCRECMIGWIRGQMDGDDYIECAIKEGWVSEI